MLLSKKVDVYRKQDKVILQVSAGPGGWVSAIWSYCVKTERFELNVSLHSHGLTSLGSVSLRATHVSPQFLNHDSELTTLVHSPRAMLWHPSGERLVIIEGGRVFIFGVAWISKTRRNAHEIQTTHISMKRATEISSDQLEEEDRTEQEGHITSHEVIGVRISLRQVSTHIGASAATVACTMFSDISGTQSTGSGTAHTQNSNNANATNVAAQKPPISTSNTSSSTGTGSGGTHSVHNGRILVGTESGAVLSVAWGLPGDDINYTTNITNTTNYNDLDQSNHSVYTTSTLSYTQHGDIHDVYDLEDEGRNRAHSYTNAGRLLATVVCAASNSISGVQPVYGSTTTSANNMNNTTTNNANTNNTIHSEELRELLRIWQKPVFRLQALTSTPLNSLNADNIPEVLDIGDVGTFVDDNATTMVEVDLNVSNHSSVYEHGHSKGGNSYKRVSYSATSVREIVCSDRNKCVVIVYGDGSFSVCMLVPVVVHVSNSSTTHTAHTPHSTLTTPRTPHPTQHTPHSAQTILPTTTIHTFVVHVSAKIHPVVLVAYPIPPTATVPSTNVSNGSGGSGSTSASNSGKDDNASSSADNTSQPDVYQLSNSGAYRSTTYTTSFDVEHTLDLSASLLQKVSRMRKLVTGRAEEEISRVLCVRVVYDTSVVCSSANSSDNNGAIRVVALVQSKHMPALHSTYTTLRGEVLSVTRQESLSLVVYDVGLYSVDSSVSSSTSSGSGNGGEGREIKCNVLHSICIDKNITTSYSTEPSLHLIHLPSVHNTHVLIHHADNRVSCRSMSDMYSVVFVVNPVPLSPSPSLTTVSVCMNRILLTVWDSHTHSSSAVSTAATPKHNAHSITAPTTHTHIPLYGTAKSLHLPTTNTTSSRIVVLPIHTTVVNKVESQSALMYADLTEGTLHTIDIDASKCTPLSTVADTDTTFTTNTTTTAANATTATNTSTDDNTYTAPLLTTQLKLPRKLLTDITHYHTLCSVNNPFQPRSTYRSAQEGLLVVSSKQCREVVFDPVLYSKHGVSNTNTNTNTNNSNISNSNTEYLAMIAGGSTVPYKHTTSSSTMTTTTTNTTTHNTYTNTTPTTTPTRRAPLLYVYNTTTNRWRGTYLIAGNRESSACLVKDIPTMQSVRKPEYSQLYGTSGSGKRYSAKLAVSVDSGSGSGKHHTNAANSTNTTTNATTLKSASVDSAHSAEHNTSPTISKSYKRRNSDNNITTTPNNSTATTINNTNSSKDISTGFSVRSLFSFNNNTANNTNTNANNTITTYKHSISTPINARSQLAGSASSIVSLAWYGTHSIVLLTLRRSTYCIEVISREASKSSMSVGKLQPLVHKIIMLPPGYSPCSMECIVVSSNSRSNSSSIDSNTSNVYNDHTPHTTNTIYEGNEYDSDTDSVSSENSLFNDTTNSAFSLQVPTPHTTHNSSVPGMHTPHSVRSVSSTGTTTNNNTTSTTTSSGINGCVVVVSDNTTLLCYHIQAQGVYTTSTSAKGSAKVTTNTTTNANITSTNTSTSKGNTLQITDYHVTELWDTNLTTLALNESTTTNTSNTSNSTPGTNKSSTNTNSNNPTTNTNNTATSATNASNSHTGTTTEINKLLSATVQFPVKEVKVFVQNIPLHEHQVEGYQRLSSQYHNSTLSGVPTFPVVSLYLLDYSGSVYSVDPECNVCSYVCSNVSSIGVLSSGDVCMNRVSDSNSGTSSGSTVVNSVIGEPLLLHTTHDPAADAQRHLLYIFTKTSLIQHIRPHALYTQHRLQYANTLHIPVNILVKHGVDKNSVHTFDESDLQRKRSRVYTHTGCVDIKLSTTHNTLLHTTHGMIVALGTKHVNISDYMRNRNHTAPITHNTNSSVLQFVPYLCTAFNNTLHNVLNSDETPAVILNLHNSTDVPPLHTTLPHTTLLHTMSTQLLNTARRTTTYTALLIAYLEHVVMQYTLAPNFNYKHMQYARLTQFLYSQDPTLLGEVLTRVGRKLEPAVSHLLFPVMVYGSGSEDTTAPYTTSILRLYESFLTTHHYHHAARVLSLACECIGGSESHISTTSALILALELLQCSVRSVSLRNSVECVDFCVRLESMLVMHSRAIFGESGSGSPRMSRKHVTGSTSSSGNNSSSGDTNTTTSINARTLDNSYTSTVKSKAMSLIHYTRDRVYRQTQHTIHTMRTNKDSVNSLQSVFTPTAAASPALPFYLGMGVGWILTKAVNSLIPETNNNSSNNSNNIVGHNGSSGNSGGSSAIQSGGTSGKNGGSIGVGSSVFALNVNTASNTTNTANNVHSVYTSDDLLRQCMVPTSSQVHTNNIALIQTTHTNTTNTNNTNTSSNSSVYQYSVIDTLEQKYGSVALSQMLVRTQLPPVYGSASSSGGTSITPNTTAISPPNGIPTNNTTNNTIPNNIGDQSPTALLLVHTLTDMFRSSTHYCNAAALLVALLQHGTSVELLHHYLLTMYGNTGTTTSNSTDTTNSTSNSNTVTSTNMTANTSSTGSVGAESSEKVRRILFVYRLNKVLSRTSLTSTTTIIHVPTPPTTNHTTTSTRNTIQFTHTVPTNNTVTSLLTQRVSAQYLRRVIEADSIHYAYNTTSYTHGMNSSGHGSPRYSAVNKANMGETPRATTVSGGGNVGNSNGNSEQWSGERRAGYFELTEELLVHNRSAAGSGGDSGSSGVNADSATATTHTTHLTILTILKSLSVGLLLVGDSAAAGILLHTILPHIMHVDSVLYNVLLQLPRVSSVGTVSVSSSVSTGTAGSNSSSVGDSHSSIGSSGPSGSDGENRQVWVLNTEQLNSLFNALVN